MRHIPDEISALANTPLAIFVLGVGVALSGNWITSSMNSAKDSSAITVRVDVLDKRVTDLQTQFVDNRHDALSTQRFEEFRLGNEKRLDGIAQDIRDLLAEVNSDQRAKR